ncbi:MAG: hypothetical protein CSA39_02210, partial [Flavobacteriales bacterium]
GDEVFGAIDTITNGETPINKMDEFNVKTVTQDNIDYKLYYLLLNEGGGEAITRYDSVFIKYRGFLLDSTKFDGTDNASWRRMAGEYNGQYSSYEQPIDGWKEAIPLFKAGINISEDDEPLKFEDSGHGIIFIPSGLAYRNFEHTKIPKKSPLIFFIETDYMNKSDYDNDGVPDSLEDINEDGFVIDDDTDGDRIPNFNDRDDDGDGILTKDESKESTDPNNPNLPDYLNPDWPER